MVGLGTACGYSVVCERILILSEHSDSYCMAIELRVMPDQHRALPRHRHQQQLRRLRQSPGRLRRAHHRPQRDRPRHQARHRQDPGEHTGLAGVHHPEGDQDIRFWVMRFVSSRHPACAKGGTRSSRPWPTRAVTPARGDRPKISRLQRPAPSIRGNRRGDGCLRAIDATSTRGAGRSRRHLRGGGPERRVHAHAKVYAIGDEHPRPDRLVCRVLGRPDQIGTLRIEALGAILWRTLCDARSVHRDPVKSLVGPHGQRPSPRAVGLGQSQNPLTRRLIRVRARWQR